MTDWRLRQQDLLDRAKRLSDTRRDALRQKLYKSRGEPIPDGAMFYAWRTIEARARQEATLLKLPTAIDLEPPGSQADQYDLGPDGRPTRVWYASYGSNLHRDRFMTYIEGGKPEGGSRTYSGCGDKSEPEGDISIRFAGARPHFALRSRVWNGGIAFIDDQVEDQALSLGRAYNISISQFDDVVAQENGLSAKWAQPVPLEGVLATGRAVTGPGSYETMLHIGDYQGAPVLTFTAPFSTNDALTGSHVLGSRAAQPSTGSEAGKGADDQALLPVNTGTAADSPNASKGDPWDAQGDGPVDSKGFPKNKTTKDAPKTTRKAVERRARTNKPSVAYLRMIGSGLNEAFGMSEVQQADYLRGCPGGDQWTRREMVSILRGEDPRPGLTNTGSWRSSTPSTAGSSSTGTGSTGSQRDQERPTGTPAATFSSAPQQTKARRKSARRFSSAPSVAAEPLPESVEEVRARMRQLDDEYDLARRADAEAHSARLEASNALRRAQDAGARMTTTLRDRSTGALFAAQDAERHLLQITRARATLRTHQPKRYYAAGSRSQEEWRNEGRLVWAQFEGVRAEVDRLSALSARNPGKGADDVRRTLQGQRAMLRELERRVAEIDAALANPETTPATKAPPKQTKSERPTGKKAPARKTPATP